MTENRVIASAPLNSPDWWEEGSKLSGLEKYRTFRRMVQTDGQVSGAIAALIQPILAARWSWEWDGPVDERVADYLAKAYDRQWRDRLRVILDYLPFGVQSIQQTFEARAGLWWPRLTTRAPDTWWRWHADNAGEPTAVEVYGYSGDSPVRAKVPVAQLWMWINDPSSDQDLFGAAMLRPAYRHWFAKGKLDTVRSIGHERFAMGTPVVRYDENAPGADDLENAVKQLRQHERGYLMVSSRLVRDVGDIQILERTGGGDSSLNDTIRYHDQQISAAMLAMWMNLGTSDTGSRAVGDTQVRMALKRAASAASYIGEVYTEMVARAIVHNFGGSAPVPRWVASGIDETDPGIVADYAVKLSTAGLLTPGPEVEAYLRQSIGLPAKQEAQTAGPTEDSVTALSERKGRAMTAIEARCLDVVAMAASREDLDSEGVRIVEGWTAEARARASRYLEPLIRAQDFAKIAAFEVGKRRDLQDRLVQIALDAAKAGRSEAQAEVRRQSGVGLSAVPPLSVIESAAYAVHRGDTSASLRTVALGRAISSITLSGSEPADVAEWARSSGLALADDAPSFERIAAAAKARADRIASEVQAEAINAAISAASTTPPSIATFEELLSRGAKMATAAAVSEVVGAGLAAGRAEGYDRAPETPREWVYSAILDGKECPVCFGDDQTTAPTRAELPPVPNPACEGGTARCRCVHIGVIE